MSGLHLGNTGTFKIILLAVASAFVLGMLLYSQRLTGQLLERERQVVDLYSRSYEYISGEHSATGDYSFLFEVYHTIDFPVILTDRQNEPQAWKNIDVDTTLSLEQQKDLVRPIVARMDAQNRPIAITLNDTLVLSYIHYGESDLIGRLRWMPIFQIALAAIFILVAYVGFSYIKRTEQSNIWVGMAKETAHQLGTPLSSMIGWLERAGSADGIPPSVSESLHEMEHDVARLNKVAARFSKIGSRPDLREEDVAGVIRDVRAYIARRMSRSGSVDITVEPAESFMVPINRDLFEWVIENLMKNALDAMDGQPGKITIQISRSAGKTTIDVIDTGKGIDPRFHKEVFRPGYSTKKRGWGLGLTLAKRIIEEYHGGKLYVKQSAPGAGTTFRMRLG
jgi:signal transduction histidine kinase